MKKETGRTDRTMVIAVTGLPVSGKNTVAEFLVRAYGFRLLEYTRDVLAPLLRTEGKELTRDKLSAKATELRRKRGADILTRLLAQQIQPGGRYVIAGLRAKEEAEFLRRKFGGYFYLIGVVADPNIRYRRARERNIKGEGGLTRKQFLDKDRLPTETIIAEAMGLADAVVENNGTVAELEGKVRAILTGLKN